MKKYKQIIGLLSAILMLLPLAACSNSDEDLSTEQIVTTLQNYKWVYSYTEEPLVDDDMEWIILDEGTITLYFVNDNECVLRHYRKHYDSDYGTSSTNESKTINYQVINNTIYLDETNFMESELKYGTDNLFGNNSTYVRKTITSSDVDWLRDNYTPIKDDSESDDEGSGEIDQEMETAIKRGVIVTDSYIDWIWSFKIKSTLEEEFPSKKFTYAIQLDLENCYNKSDLLSNKYQDYYESKSGDAKTIVMSTPFWYYFINNGTLDMGVVAECEMYYASYQFLLSKPTSDWTVDEKNLFSNIKGMFRKYEYEAQWLSVDVLVIVDSKVYKVYNKNIHSYIFS